jgi:hypothetical protein
MVRRARQLVTRVAAAALVLAAVSFGGGLGLTTLGAQTERQSSASAVPPPTATYVSELAPAVMVPPRQPAALPASGAGASAATGWPKAAGLGLALLGVLFVHAALSLRPDDRR